MKLITRNTDYGIRALCFIAKAEDRVVPVPELVKALNIPRPFLRKILQALTRRCFIRSYKGIGGGFRLSADAGSMRLVDLIEACQGPLEINECLFKKVLCPNRTACFLKKRIDRIELYIRKELGSITIGELIKK